MNNFEQLPLRDIHLPDPVSWWPPAIGWWLLVVAIVLAAIGIWLGIRHLATRQRRNRLYHLAEREINRIETEYRAAHDSHLALQKLSILMRRIGMTVYDRKRIASLCGDEWTDWLTNSSVPAEARAGSIRLLADGPYNKDVSADLSPLISHCRVWLRSITKDDVPVLSEHSRGVAAEIVVAQR